jgi:predicted nucleic acid-binding protein
VIDGWLARPQVVPLAPGDEHWRILRSLLTESGTAGNLTTDAHLAALAIEHGAELCSTDGDFARFRACAG